MIDELESVEPTEPVGQFVDERTLADLLCMPVRTLQDWRARGNGPPFYKFGKSVRYRVPEVVNWLDEQRKASTWE